VLPGKKRTTIATVCTYKNIHTQDNIILCFGWSFGLIRKKLFFNLHPMSFKGSTTSQFGSERKNIDTNCSALSTHKEKQSLSDVSARFIIAISS